MVQPDKDLDLEFEKRTEGKGVVTNPTEQTEQVEKEESIRFSGDIFNELQEKRQFHYNGVKPIMMFVGIKEPLNVVLLYLLTVIFVGGFIIGKLIQGTIGVLLNIIREDNKSKAEKTFMWTIIVAITAFTVIATLIMFLKWVNLI